MSKETQVVKIDEPMPESAAIIQVIERAAMNPDVDVDKMERLFVMRNEMHREQSEQAFNAAMSLAQSEMGRVSADATNPQTRSKYASYGQLDKALRPVYTGHGFALSFSTGEGAPDGCVRVLCYVSHREGHTRTYQADMPADGKGAKGGDVMTKTHAAGAAFTYGQRYLLKLIFNVAIGEDDTDGNVPAEKIDTKNAEILTSHIKSTGMDLARFLKAFSIAEIAELPAARFNEAMDRLNQFDAKQKADG
jgi:hypothetical protein